MTTRVWTGCESSTKSVNSCGDTETTDTPKCRGGTSRSPAQSVENFMWDAVKNAGGVPPPPTPHNVGQRNNFYMAVTTVGGRSSSVKAQHIATSAKNLLMGGRCKQITCTRSLDIAPHCYQLILNATGKRATGLQTYDPHPPGELYRGRVKSSQRDSPPPVVFSTLRIPAKLLVFGRVRT